MRASKFMDSLKSTDITMDSDGKDVLFNYEIPDKKIPYSSKFQEIVINDLARKAYKAIYENYGFDHDYLSSHSIIFHLYWVADRSHYHIYDYLLSDFQYSKLSPASLDSRDNK
jgi:hypothetical protein